MNGQADELRLRERVGDEDWDRYTRAGESCQFYGVAARDMTREELLVLLGFALTDWPNVRQYPIERSRTPG